MKISKRQLRRIIKETEESRGDRLVSHMVDALVAHLGSEDMLLSTDEVTDWLLGEFKLSQPGSPVPHGLIDRVLNDVRLDDLYDPRDDAWGQSEVPYAGPGDSSTARGLTTGWAVQETDDKSRRVGGGQAWSDEESKEESSISDLDEEEGTDLSCGQLEENIIKITKRQLRRIISEETQYAGNLEDVAAAQTEIENILNSLWNSGVENDGLKALLNNIIRDIDAGFVGEPT